MPSAETFSLSPSATIRIASSGRGCRHYTLKLDYAVMISRERGCPKARSACLHSGPRESFAIMAEVLRGAFRDRLRCRGGRDRPGSTRSLWPSSTLLWTLRRGQAKSNSGAIVRPARRIPWGFARSESRCLANESTLASDRGGGFRGSPGPTAFDRRGSAPSERGKPCHLADP
jgi:hypothetical protein